MNIANCNNTRAYIVYIQDRGLIDVQYYKLNL